MPKDQKTTDSQSSNKQETPSTATGESINRNKGAKSSSFFSTLLFGIVIAGIIYIAKNKEEIFGLKTSLNYKDKTLSGHFNNKMLGNLGVTNIVGQFNSFVEKAQGLELNLTLNNIDTTGAIQLANGINALTNLQSIKLNFAHNPIKDEGIQILLARIAALTKVTDLELHFDAVGATKSCSSVFSGTIGKMTNLKRLYISFVFNTLNNQGVKALAKSISELKNLNSLDFIIAHNGVNKDGIQPIADMIDSIGSKLTNFGLSLFANQIGQEGAAIIGPSIAKLANVNNLYLDHYFNNLTVTGSYDISNAVGALTQLKGLRLSFDFNNIENDGGKVLGENLAKLADLESLTVNVGTKNFGFPGFNSIAKAIVDLKKLEHLVLKLAINKVGIQGAMHIQKIFESLTKLKTVNIDFKENYIGSPNIYIMSAINQRLIANNPDLYSYDFSLAFNDLNGKAALQAVEAFKQFKNMQYLRLDLSQNEIDDEDIEPILKAAREVSENQQLFEFLVLSTAISFEKHDDLNRDWVNKDKRFDLKINTVKKALNDTDIPDWLKEVREAEKERGERSKF